MDLAERMAVVEGRLDRVERVLGLPGKRVASVVDDLPVAVLASPRPGARAEAARDLLEDPGVAPRADPGGLVSDTPVPGSPPPPLRPPPPPRSSTPSARPPSPAPRAAARRSPPPVVPAARGDMERFVGVAILGRVGIAAVLLAAGYFAQLAYASFPPALRVASIYALAGVLILVGHLVRPKVAPRYVAILWGGGAAAAYMAGVVARMRYSLFPEGVALAALVASCALGQVLAQALKQRTLALVALAGAIAAPVLVGGTADSRTVLLVYLLTLHAWAWFIETRHGATGARPLALLGVPAVALLWAGTHGRVDLSTCVHLHLYLVGLTFPEWASLARGRGVPGRGAALAPILLGIAEAAMLATFAVSLSGFTAERYLLHRTLLVAGLAWAVPPVLGRLRAGSARPGSASFTRLAGLCIAVGLFFLAGDPAWSGDAGFHAVLVASATFAVLSLGAAPRLGAGDLAAAFASGLPLLLLMTLDPRDPVRAFAFVGPVALLLRGSRPPARIAGLALGLLAAFGGIVLDPSPWRPTVCVALAAAVTGLAFVRGRRLKDDVLVALADLVLVALACFVAWGATEMGALRGAFQSVSPAILNPGTVAAAVLAVALALRLRAEAPTTPLASGSDPILRVVLGALLVAAGWREVHAALRHVEALDLRAALGALYLAATGSVFFLAAARRRDALLAFEGLACVGIGIALAIAHGRVPGRAWVSGVELTGLLAAVGAGAVLLRSSFPQVRVALGIAAVGVAFAWFRHVTGGRLGAELRLLNPRTLVAALTVALLILLRTRTREPALRGVHLALGLAAAALAFGAGLVEVLDAVHDLPSGPIRSVLVSVYAMGFSAVLLFLGFRRRSREVRWLALAGFACTVGKVGLHDLASVETPWRILVTGCLGVVLLGAAYAYARRDRTVGDADAGGAGASGPLPPPPPAS